MDPVRNPFVPGAGASPPELAGRRLLLEQVEVVFQRALRGRVAKSFIAVGLRGVGKTVVLNRAAQLARDAGFKVCLIEAHEKKALPLLLVPHLRRMLLELDRLGALSEQVKRSLRVLKSFVSGLKIRYGDAELELDVEAEHGAADSGDLEADLPELMASLGRAAASRQLGVAIILDEIQYLDERDMSALIMSMHRVMQDSLPVVLVAAGLPQVVGLSGRSKSYAERLFDFPPIGALAPDDARLALAGPVHVEGASFSEAALDRIVETTRGYPYFLQEWGYHSWNVSNGPEIGLDDVEEANGRAIRALDSGFFRVRYDRLTPREKAYCHAMAGLGSGAHRSGDVAEAMGARVQSVAPLRDGLIRKGMIYSPAHGDTDFTVPLFDQFLHRLVPAAAGPRS